MRDKLLKKQVDLFFKTAREREKIRLARLNGQPPPWTKDEVLSNYRFTNVRREDDRVTQWFRENLRDPLAHDPKQVILATTVFRTFNLIETGRKLRPMLLDGRWDPAWVRNALHGQQPIVTGAYIVRSPHGMKKLPGICQILNGFVASGAIDQVAEAQSLEWAHSRLVQVPYFGFFTSYEVVSDLRWTCVLEHAEDILTWANPGPGALRGMSYLVGRELRPCQRDREECLHLMQQLLERSKAKCNWPHTNPLWEMREVEHWLCEFSKYQHATEGKRLKRRFP